MRRRVLEARMSTFCYHLAPVHVYNTKAMVLGVWCQVIRAGTGGRGGRKALWSLLFNAIRANVINWKKTGARTTRVYPQERRDTRVFVLTTHSLTKQRESAEEFRFVEPRARFFRDQNVTTWRLHTAVQRKTIGQIWPRGFSWPQTASRFYRRQICVSHKRATQIQSRVTMQWVKSTIGA